MNVKQTLKQAVEAMLNADVCLSDWNRLEASITQCKQAIEWLDKQEPVAWLRKDGFKFIGDIEPEDDYELPLYLHPLESKESEQPSNMVTVPLDKLEDMQRRLKAYESKPLSDDEIQKTIDDLFGDFTVSRGFMYPVYVKIARAIEVALMNRSK